MHLNSNQLKPQQEELYSMLQIIWLINQEMTFKLTKKQNEIINPKESNIIIGCIYRYHNMHLNDFNNDYLNSLLAKLSKEKK